MADIRAKWLAFYSENLEPLSKELFSHVEKLIVGTLIISAGAHVSSTEPAIVLFGYLRHGLVGRGVELIRGDPRGAVGALPEVRQLRSGGDRALRGAAGHPAAFVQRPERGPKTEIRRRERARPLLRHPGPRALPL